MDSIYISQGLSHNNLKTIHKWLIHDYDFENNQGLLSSFMTLVKHKDKCWGLFHLKDNIIVCIGFALLFDTTQSLHIDLFSLHHNFRKLGWGKRFILTLINNISTNKIITLNSLPNAVPFWKKTGFIRQDDNINGEIKMYFDHYPEYLSIPFKFDTVENT